MPQYFNQTTYKNRRQALRNNAPKAEHLLWAKLKSKQLLGYKFRRQYSVGPYVIDIYCPALKLAIEVDGVSHLQEDSTDQDGPRQNFIESFGIQFLRFTNDEIYRNMDGVLYSIVQTARAWHWTEKDIRSSDSSGLQINDVVPVVKRGVCPEPLDPL